DGDRAAGIVVVARDVGERPVGRPARHGREAGAQVQAAEALVLHAGGRAGGAVGVAVVGAGGAGHGDRGVGLADRDGDGPAIAAFVVGVACVVRRDVVGAGVDLVTVVGQRHAAGAHARAADGARAAAVRRAVVGERAVAFGGGRRAGLADRDGDRA